MLDIYRLGVNVYRKNIDTFLFISESRLCWRTTEIELGTEVHSPGIFVRNERIPKKNESGGLGGSQVRARSCDPPNPPKRGGFKICF